MQSFIGGPAHFVFRLRQNFHQAQYLVRLGTLDEFGKFLLGRLRQGIEICFRVHLGDEDFPNGGNNFGKELSHVPSRFRLFMEKVEKAGQLLLENQRQRLGYGFP